MSGPKTRLMLKNKNQHKFKDLGLIHVNLYIINLR